MVNKLLTYTLIVAYIQYVIMLIDTKKSAKSEAEMFVYHSQTGMYHTKNYDCECLVKLIAL
jgi:hypothetical protein